VTGSAAATISGSSVTLMVRNPNEISSTSTIPARLDCSSGSNLTLAGETGGRLIVHGGKELVGIGNDQGARAFPCRPSMARSRVRGALGLGMRDVYLRTSSSVEPMISKGKGRVRARGLGLGMVTRAVRWSGI
jgi:hypothetical protein